VYSDQTLTELDSLKFLGLHIDSQFTLKFHIDLLLHNLSIACFVVRNFSYALGRDAIKSAYFAYCHSLIRFIIIFRGSSANAYRVFLLQDRVIRIIIGVDLRCSGCFRN
jgi:hypothetical protein